MKRIGKIVGVVALTLLFLGTMFLVTAPRVNDASAGKIQKELEISPLPENTELVEGVSKAGKLTGNGNGMQFFGAILIKSDLSLEELNDYYSAYRKHEDDCIVNMQNGQKVELIEHGTLEFLAEVIEGEQYYIVYSWGEGMAPFNEFDLRGH